MSSRLPTVITLAFAAATLAVVAFAVRLAISPVAVESPSTRPTALPSTAAPPPPERPLDWMALQDRRFRGSAPVSPAPVVVSTPPPIQPPSPPPATKSAPVRLIGTIGSGDERLAILAGSSGQTTVAAPGETLPLRPGGMRLIRVEANRVTIEHGPETIAIVLEGRGGAGGRSTSQRRTGSARSGFRGGMADGPAMDGSSMDVDSIFGDLDDEPMPERRGGGRMR